VEVRSRRGFERALPAALLAGLGAALVFAVGGASSRIAQSFHGLNHSAYIYQIHNGIVPPTNPSSLGMPANFYWGYHAVLALGMEVLDVTPFEMSVTLNAAALAGFLLAMWLAAGRFTKDPWLRLGCSLLPFFILNPVGLSQFTARVAGVWVPEILRAPGQGVENLWEHLLGIARHHEALRMVDQDIAQLLPRFGDPDATTLSRRAGSLINKFFNFNSFPVALALYTGSIQVLFAKGLGPYARAALLLPLVFATALMSPLPVAAFGVVVAADFIVRLTAPADPRTTGRKGAIGHARVEAALPLMASGLAVLLSLPILLPVALAYEGRVHFHGASGSLMRHAVYIGWALIPSLLVQLLALRAFRRLSPEARVCAITACIYSLAAMTLALPVQDPNEYKLVLLSSVPTSLLLLALGVEWGKGSRLWDRAQPVLRAALRTAFVGAGAIAIAATSLLYLASSWSREEPFVYQGWELQLTGLDESSQAAGLQGAYDWLRERTPATAYVLEIPVGKDESLAPVVAQRRSVAELPSPYTLPIPHHALLVERTREVAGRLATCSITREDLRRLFAVPAPWPGEIFALTAMAAGASHGGDFQASCGEALPVGVALEYSNSAYAVFRISSSD
jgi:hypothetical protein